MTFASALLPLLLAQAAAPATPALLTFKGRGVYTFDSAIPCPLQGAGARGANACNRIALDDNHTTATVDVAAKVITFTNTFGYAETRVIGDLLLLGTAQTEAHKIDPVAVHLKIEKHGNRAISKVHGHVVNHDAIKTVALDAYEVKIVTVAGKSEVALTPALADKALLDSGLMDRLAGALVEVRDNTKARAWSRGAPIADIDIGVGVSKAAKWVLNARLVPGGTWDHAPGAVELLKTGDWSLELKALSSLVPKEVVQRDLFLFGVEGAKVLASVKQDGLAKGEVLSFSMKGGKGAVGLDANTEEIPQAAEVARAFLEFSFIGSVLANQADLRSGAAAPSPTPAAAH